ncbi:hypothetical protein F511_32313 [Dorcoceras hygrometricum]|uniref:Uncharacterized protein n=1 Tax=Dorcoceras hygrometricum TaxID=472368 RepID=A0A2Z7CM67_9LAMI|nr:hypothetical protein F511_32313 [Dorcoceras hygrometricum]
MTEEYKRRRDKSRDVVNSSKSRIIILEVYVGDMEERHAIHEERYGDLHGEMQGSLSSAIRDLVQRNEALEDMVHRLRAEVEGLKEALATSRATMGVRYHQPKVDVEGSKTQFLCWKNCQASCSHQSKNIQTHAEAIKKRVKFSLLA